MTEADAHTEMLDRSVRAFLDATAARQSIPGGGSVAGVVAALGTALGEMALAFTRGKAEFAEHEDAYADLERRWHKARAMAAELVAEDAQAYDLYRTTRREHGVESPEFQQAVAAAVNVPRELTKLALNVLGDMRWMSGRCNRWLLSDLAAGAVLAEAAIRLCDYNVGINATAFAERAAATEVVASSRQDCERARALTEDIERIARERIGSP